MWMKGNLCCLKTVVEQMSQDNFSVWEIHILLMIGMLCSSLTVYIKWNILKTGIKSDYKGWCYFRLPLHCASFVVFLKILFILSSLLIFWRDWIRKFSTVMPRYLEYLLSSITLWFICVSDWVMDLYLRFRCPLTHMVEYCVIFLLMSFGIFDISSSHIGYN